MIGLLLIGIGVAVAAATVVAALRAARNHACNSFGNSPVGTSTQSCTDETPLKKWQNENKVDIEQALADQKKMLESKKAELSKWDANAKAKFKKAFGKDDEASKKVISERIDRMLKVNEKTTVDNFRPADESMKDVYAYVYPDDKAHAVYLGSHFGSAPATGQDSKAGTLAHEMSHFEDVGSTKDKFKDYNDDQPVYGLTSARQLAQDDSDLALKHADSFEYYIEDVP